MASSCGGYSGARSFHPVSMKFARCTSAAELPYAKPMETHEREIGGHCLPRGGVLAIPGLDL